MIKNVLAILIGLAAAAGISQAESGPGWITYAGGDGPGKGKHIVLLAGDQEYRSEEAMPMLAKILAKRHGFTCTVLFSIDPDGTINPDADQSLGKPEALESADAIITALRFRKWPDATMGIFEKAVGKGIPIIGLRTSTHMFQLPGTSGYSKFNKFGKDVLGEQWVNHWGKHGSEGTRAIPESAAANDPLLRGVGEIFCTTDVYEAYPPSDATILLRGQVVNGMTAKDPAAAYQKQRASDKQMQDINTPMMPIAWHREVKTGDKSQRVLCTTMGAATDLTEENLRRLVVNGVFWGLGMDVPAKADVTIVGDYQPEKFGVGGGKKGLKAADFEMK